MEGISHPLFRQMMVEHGGLHLVCTEFVRITNQPPHPGQLATNVRKADGVPLSVQVMGNSAAHMADAAAIVSDAGADVVDINLGCPMPRVVRKGVGAAMLKDPALLTQVLEQMRRRTPGLLSAKIRAGFDDTRGVVATAKLIEACGVDFITVHPRRRCDFYRGTADWRIIRELVRELRIPVVGNGDVWYAKDALRMQEETGCAAVMIGRPALRNPWLFRQIDELRRGETPFAPSGQQLFDHLHSVIERYTEAFPKRKYGPIGPLKELLGFVGRAIPARPATGSAAQGTSQFRRDVLRLDNVSAILECCERDLRPLPAEALDLDASGSLGLEQSGSAIDGHAPDPPSPRLARAVGATDRTWSAA
jgi:nifR3 family TIM-barrel protein